MASYYKAAERSLTRNCSADWIAVTKYVDHTFNGKNTTLTTELKFDLLKARLSGPGGNTTGVVGLTKKQAEATSNADAASILMDPLDFYQVRRAWSFFGCVKRGRLTYEWLPYDSIMASQPPSSLFATSLRHATLQPRPWSLDWRQPAMSDRPSMHS